MGANVQVINLRMCEPPSFLLPRVLALAALPDDVPVFVDALRRVHQVKPADPATWAFLARFEL